MKIDQARQILFTHAYEGQVPSKEALREAELLGIEALREIEAARAFSVGLIPPLLPGETLE